MLELQNLTVGFDGESILKNINMILMTMNLKN